MRQRDEIALVTSDIDSLNDNFTSTIVKVAHNLGFEKAFFSKSGIVDRGKP